MVPTCVLCPIYNPGSPARARDRAQTCPACRHQLDRDLHAVAALHARALDPAAEIADLRRRVDGTMRNAINALLPMAPTPPPSAQPRVSGTRERTIPLDVQLTDLTAAARPIGVSYQHPDDQVGVISVASVLLAWCWYWQAHFQPYSAARTPHTVPEQVAWIQGARLETLVDVDPRIGQFAYQLRHLRRSLQYVLGDTVPYPAVMAGVPCRRCDRVSTLILDLEDPDRYRECTACGLLLTEEEYKTWLLECVERLRPAPDPDDTAPPAPESGPPPGSGS